VLALLLIGGVVFVWQKKQSMQISEVKQIEEEQAEPTPAEKYPQHIEAIQGSDEVWYNIPELGVRMRLNRGFAEDLVYGIDATYGDAVSFQKKSVMAAAPQCNVMSADFGYLYRVNGTIEEADRNNLSSRGDRFFASLSDYGMIAQLPGFFVALSTDRADACWWGKEKNLDAELAVKYTYPGSGAQSVWDSIKNKTVESIPEG
jgi:hypothetical protein